MSTDKVVGEILTRALIKCIVRDKQTDTKLKYRTDIFSEYHNYVRKRKLAKQYTTYYK